jgi:predicted signal transduction protein with EAL and GGDEF domain
MNKIFLYERFSGVLKTTETEKGGASGFATADFPLRLKPKTRVGSLEEVLLFTKEDIEKGLENNEFEVHYQPIIDLQNNTVISGEALVRWNTPKYGMLFPKSFISIAEDTGAIYALGEFVLRSACAQSVKWKIFRCFSWLILIL